jgi:transposase InsO family protein
MDSGAAAQAGDPGEQGNDQEVHATSEKSVTAAQTEPDLGDVPGDHASEIWACDFVQTCGLFFRTVFVYFIVELGSRKVVRYGVTRSQSDVWVAQQVREATPYAEGPRFLIRDNDKKYGRCFTRVAEDRQIEMLKTPVEAPQANAICERFIGSVRRECLDHMVILNERHLHRLIGEYIIHRIFQPLTTSSRYWPTHPRSTRRCSF